jgi:hypothetical protein
MRPPIVTGSYKLALLATSAMTPLTRRAQQKVPAGNASSQGGA